MGFVVPYKVGDVINKRYRVEQVFPPGGMGLVARVTRLRDGAELALKYCRRTTPDYVRRFGREVRMMQSIEHPNVLPIMAFSLKHKPPYFTMPLATGSIHEELANLSTNEDEALDVFESICLGVQATHAAGTIHRDVKPANALRLDDGRVVVCDLGLAKLEERDTTILTQTRAIVGTDIYLAPEQKLPDGSRDADARTDVYQLGKTLYELLTGSTPVLMDLKKLPSGLAHIVRKATREQPSERYQTVAQLLDAIELYKRAKDPAARPVEAFEAILAVVGEGARRARFNPAELEQALAFLDGVDPDDDQIFLELFDKLPDKVLRVCATELAGTFEPVLRRYVDVIERTIRGENFAYAETVADKMEIVLAGADSPEIAVLALRAAVTAAVDLNRFAAMSTVQEMLVTITDDGIAMAAAEMLGMLGPQYAEMAGQVPGSKLHPALRNLRTSKSSL